MNVKIYCIAMVKVKSVVNVLLFTLEIAIVLCNTSSTNGRHGKSTSDE